MTTASNPQAHAEGNNTRAIGTASHSEGANTTAAGDRSHAEGNATLATGAQTHAEGTRTTSIGPSSHSEGEDTFSSTNYAHSEGNFTTASGTASHAEGAYTSAQGQWSHAQGLGALANNIASFAMCAGNQTNPPTINGNNQLQTVILSGTQGSQGIGQTFDLKIFGLATNTNPTFPQYTTVGKFSAYSLTAQVCGHASDSVKSWIVNAIVRVNNAGTITLLQSSVVNSQGTAGVISNISNVEFVSTGSPWEYTVRITVGPGSITGPIMWCASVNMVSAFTV